MNEDGGTVLITGGARRIGAAIASRLHESGYKIALHYRESAQDVQRLSELLNHRRNQSVRCFKADLSRLQDLEALAEETNRLCPDLVAVVNNASTFFPTAMGQTTEADWDHLMKVNLRAPYFLVQALLDTLRKNHGCVVNITDIYAERPLAGHPVYSATKAGLVSLTRSLARELAPDVRVNAVSPGAILWPENGEDPDSQAELLDRVPMNRLGDPEDIAATALFLIRGSRYITGQVVAVDGGRSVVA